MVKFEGLFSIRQNFEPTLANFISFGACFLCCKWPYTINLPIYVRFEKWPLIRHRDTQVLPSRLFGYAHFCTFHLENYYFLRFHSFFIKFKEKVIPFVRSRVISFWLIFLLITAASWYLNETFKKSDYYEACFDWMLSTFSSANFEVLVLAAVWPDLAKFCHFGKISSKIFDSLFLIWQNAEPTLENLGHYGANFYYCKWPNIEK